VSAQQPPCTTLDDRKLRYVRRHPTSVASLEEHQWRRRPRAARRSAAAYLLFPWPSETPLWKSA